MMMMRISIHQFACDLGADKGENTLIVDNLLSEQQKTFILFTLHG